MTWLQALILGLIQGLTEFLPVSSSGHLEIGNVLLQTDVEENLTFTVAVHAATMLSTIVVFREYIWQLLQGLFQFKWNDETKYISKIALSMVPVAIVGVFFEDFVESLFSGNIMLVGSMLLVTATLLGFTFYAKSQNREITFLDALIIGTAQAFAVIPGISRSGSTIATGLLIGNRKDEIARFSFLMVLVPILGATVKDFLGGDFASSDGVGVLPLIVGFVAAFVSGLLACTWMINIVKRGKLIYFAVYCFTVGLIGIMWYVFQN